MPDLTPHEIRVRTRPYPATPNGITPTARRTADLGLGVLSLSARAFRGAIDQFLPDPAAGDPRNPSAVRQLGRAATGVALVAEQHALDAAEAIEHLTQASWDLARRVPILRDALVGVDASIARWSDRGDIEQLRRETAVTDFVAQLLPAIFDTLLERVDVGAIVARVPLAEIVGAIDLGAVVEQVDLDAVLAQVDVDALLRQVDVDALLERIDVDGLLARIDVDGLMSRIDLDALLGRVELGPIVADVLDDVDIGGIVRESTGSISGDAVDGARLTAMRLDTFVGRVADRVLLRGRTDRNPVDVTDDDAAPPDPADGPP